MKFVVPIKLIPDLVEELTIDESGKALDMTWLRLILNEFDNHAIEQAILLKEKYGGEVIVLAPDIEGADDALFSAAAAGADHLIKLTDLEEAINNHALGRLCAETIKTLQPDLVLTGVQAHDDLDGQLGPILAEVLGYPYVGYISSLELDNGNANLSKEFPGGLIAQMEVELPAVVGIQAAEEPPRYVAFSKVRQAMKTAVIEESPCQGIDRSGGPEITQMSLPEATVRAEMLSGDVEQIASQLLQLFQERGIL